MRIAIDVEPVYGNVTGTGVYVAEMVAHLAQVVEYGEYTLFTSKTYQGANGLDIGENGRFHRRCLPLTRKVCQGMWVLLGWPPVNRYIGDHDLYHCMTISPFPATGGRYVVTVHDLSWVVRPELFNRRHRHVWSVSQWRMLRRADHFVAVSEWTRRDMVEYLGISPERITVIPEGVREWFKPVDRPQVETVLAKHSLNEPYFLVVGDMNLRKNHLRLVRAFARLKARGSKPVQLVFCGPFGYRADQTVHEVHRLKLTDSVRFLGYLPDDDLVSLMNGASALVFTSLYEGFGLPILEAMACGTPVITSNVTSMPEVAGDAALLVDPTSEIEIAEAMWQVLTDPKACRDLAQRGRKQVQKFTWGHAARRLVELYKSIA